MPRQPSRQALETRLKELAQLADLGRNVLAAQLDSKRLAELIYQEAGKIVDATFFQVGLFEGDRYRMLIWIVDGRPRPPLEVRLTPDSLGIVGWMRESRQPLLIRDFELERDSLPARPRYISNDPPRSAVFVPLIAGERVLGAMAIQSRHPATFSEEDLRLLSIIANVAAAALENARLFEQTERRAAQLGLLAEVARRINVLQPLPSFYQQAVDLISEQFREFLVSLFILEDGALHLAATTRADWKGQTLALPVDIGPVGEAAQHRRTVTLQHFTEDETGAPAGSQRAEIAAPLIVEERVLGVLNAQSDRPVFDETVIALFESLAAQIAFATFEAQVYAAEQRRTEQLAAIAQASRAVVSTLELDDLLDEVLDLVDDRFDYRFARIFLLQDERLVYRAGTDAWEARWGHKLLAYELNGPGLIALVGRTLKPVLVDDVTQHPAYFPGPGLGETRAEMAVPLIMAGRLLGVFDVQSEVADAFTQDDLQTMQTLADTLAVAVRNARLFEAERRRRRLAETLREVSTALTSTLSLDAVFDMILSGLARVVSYDVASLLLVNEEGEVCLRATRGSQKPEVLEALGQPLAVRLFARDETLLPATFAFSQVDTEHAYHDLFDLPDPHACLGVALMVHGEHLGYLVVDRIGLEQFPEEEAELIAAFASQASVAMENARLFTAQREQAWISTALLQVAESIAQTPELEDALSTVARVTPMLVGVEWCAVLLAEAEVFTLRAYHHTGGVPQPEVGDGLQPEQWPRLGELIASQAAVVTDPDDAAPECLHDLLAGVAILLPLWVRGEVQGALVVGQAPGEAPFTAQRVRLLGGISNQASLALESAMLYEAQQEEAWVNAALLQVAEALVAQPTLDESLETVARLMPMLVGVERGVIYRWDAEHQVFRASQCIGVDKAGLDLSSSAAELGIDPAHPSSASSLNTLPERLAQVLQMQVVVLWPLWARGDLFGALVVEHLPSLGRRLNILNGIAHQLSVAMENAALADEVAQQQRLEREIELGRDIQASFLPESCPQLPGWDMAASWRSARLVGGDFYDFIPLRSEDGVERWGIAIADVSDKGVPAALFMALSRTLLRSAAINRTSPAATLARVNELILADARSPQFVTVFYGVLEPASGRLTFANAGHNPPLLARHGAEGEVVLLRAKGAALAVFAEYVYTEHELHLEPGDTLLLYTDGLPDAINLFQEEFGLPRVMETLSAARTCSAQEIVERLEAAAQHHVGNVEPFDDTTMVVVKRING